MHTLARISITSINQFIEEAHKQGYMTISKDYGILAHNGEQLTGELITEGPKGPIEPSQYDGWMRVEECKT